MIVVRLAKIFHSTVFSLIAHRLAYSLILLCNTLCDSLVYVDDIQINFEASNHE